MKIIALSCLVSLAGASQAMDWNADVVAQAKSAMAAQKLVLVEPRAVPVENATLIRITARPLGSDRISKVNDTFSDQVRLILNNDKDRVGAEFSNCTGGEDDHFCDGINYIIPELSFDQQAKTVKYGDEIVATYSKWKGLRLVNGWRLVATRVKESVDSGFNRYTITRAVVTLEK